MKKVFLGLFMAFAMISCEDEMKSEGNSTENQFISEERALAIAKIHLNMERTTSKGSSAKNQSNYQITEVNTINNENGVALMYAVNFEPAAFTIISAHVSDIPVLGFSFERNFNHEAALITPGISDWIRYHKSRIESIDEPSSTNNDEVPPTSDYIDFYENISDYGNPMGVQTPNSAIVNKGLTRSNWGQRCPYNKDLQGDCNSFGDHYPTGCVATAAAQVMYYWKKPEIYDFDGMKDTYNPLDTSGWMCHRPDDNMPKLMKDIGTATNMNYGCDASSTYLANLHDYFKTMSFYSSSIYQENFDLDIVISEIDSQRPVIVSGQLYDDQGYSTGAHAWVIDGYYIVQPYTMYNTPSGSYLHMNWGWKGNHNGNYIVKDNNVDYSDPYHINHMIYNIGG